jgi:hypothetical protein
LPQLRRKHELLRLALAKVLANRVPAHMLRRSD